MKTFILIAVVACAAGARIKLSEANQQSSCTIEKVGSSVSSSCDLKTSVTSMNSLHTRLSVVENRLNALTLQVDAQAATDVVHRRDIDKKAQKGETGSRGAKGSTGAQGAQGVQGIQGNNGAKGARGANGANGAKGARGANGANGAKGARGANGANGAKGATGAQGQKGEKGKVVTAPPTPAPFHTSCKGLAMGAYDLKPVGAYGKIRVICDGKGKTEIGAGRMTTGRKGGVSSGEARCGSGGASYGFDYTALGKSGQTNAQVLHDIQLIMAGAEMCYQNFEYKCTGSILTGHQCVNDAQPLERYGNNPHLGHASGGFKCDVNSGSNTDTGTFDKSVLPITKWLPGDIGDGGEHGELVLHQLTCYAPGSLPTSCKGLTRGTHLIKPSGATGAVKVQCDNGKTLIGGTRKTTGRKGGISSGEGACGSGGLRVPLDYTDVCVGTASEKCIQDLKYAIADQDMCYQAFEYKCTGSILSNYQCINDASTPIQTWGINPKLSHGSGDFKCDVNSGSNTDTGVFTKSVLPVAQWLPGDIGDGGEHGELILKQLTCYGDNVLPKSCSGLSNGVHLVKPDGAYGALKVKCTSGGFEMGSARKSSGQRGGVSSGEGACGSGGYRVPFDYTNTVCIGTSGDKCIHDMKILIDNASSCTQPFDYACNGSILTNYQCVNSASNALQHFATSNRCDANNGVYTDSGTFTRSVLPIAQWLPGDIGDGGEHGELILKQLSCRA